MSIRNVHRSYDGTDTPTDIYRIVDGEKKLVKRIYKVVNGEPAIVWDIGEDSNVTIVRGWLVDGESITLNGLTSYTYNSLILPTLTDGVWSFRSMQILSTDTIGTVDWGDGTEEEYHSGRDSNGNYQYATHTYSDDYIAKNTQDNGVWVEVKITCDVDYISNNYFLEGSLKLQSLDLADSIEYVCGKIFSPNPKVTGAEQATKISASMEFMQVWCYRSNLESVEIPSNVKSLGLQQMYCGVPYSTLTDSSYTFSNYTLCFMDCKKLKSVDIKGNVLVIGLWCFYDCYVLESIPFNDGLECIGHSAFGYCYKLNVPELPQTMKYIHRWAFLRVGEDAETNPNFDWSNVNYYLDRPKDDYLTTEMPKVMQYDIYIVPDSVVYIGDGAFNQCFCKAVSIPKDIHLGVSFFHSYNGILTDVIYRGSVNDWFTCVSFVSEDTNYAKQAEYIPTYTAFFQYCAVTAKTWYYDSKDSINRIVCTDGIIVNPYVSGSLSDGTGISTSTYGDNCFDSDGNAIRDKFLIL